MAAGKCLINAKYLKESTRISLYAKKENIITGNDLCECIIFKNLLEGSVED